MTLYYAGIGSRRTPGDVLDLMTRIAVKLRAGGYALRSGHAPGADQAFELGAGSDAEIYLPWPRFEGMTPIAGFKTRLSPSIEALEMAAEFHPNWEACSRGARALHARNVHQVLGRDLDSPAEFVVCWTPDGSLDGKGPNTGNTGGTGQALRIAAHHGVRVFNLQRDEHREIVVAWALDLIP